MDVRLLRPFRRFQIPVIDLLTATGDPLAVHRVILDLTYGLTIGVIAFAIGASIFGSAVPIWLIVLLGGFEFVFSAVEEATLRRGRLPAWMPAAHMTLSLLLLTIGVVYSGGVQSPFVWAYALSMAIEGILRNARWALASATVSTAYVLLATLLVRTGVIPYDRPLWSDSATVAFLISYVGMFYTIGLMAAALGDRLRQQTREITGLADRLRDSYLGTVRALVEAVEAKDVYTGGHSDRVESRAVALARALGLHEPEVEQVRFAAILHDVGKIGVPDAVLAKPGPLDPRETAVMREHADAGAAIVGQVPFLAGAARIVRHHHEWFDGRGYPDGLIGEQIPLGSRIIAVVDAYEAMTTDRPYRRGLPPETALQRLRRAGGTQFDPLVVDVFLALLQEGEGAMRGAREVRTAGAGPAPRSGWGLPGAAPRPPVPTSTRPG